jgi:hypothetical protein
MTLGRETMSRTKGTKTKLEYGDAVDVATSASWTAIAKITDITPPEIKAEDIDVSNMDSADLFSEFEPGWAEGGEVECTIQFDKTQDAAVYGLFRQPKGWRMTFADTSMWQFNGYINSFGNEVERKGIVTTKIKLKISGKPEFVPAPDPEEEP